MEELIGMLAPLFVVAISLIATVGKQSQKKQQQEQQRLQAAWQQANARRAQAQPAAPAQPARPLQPTVIQPTVHTHLQPDCDTHDAPANGSLNFVSPEGKDPCHQEQLPQRRQSVAEAAHAEQPGLTLDWNGEAMVKAFVMQEVLTRPCDRRR